MAMVEMFWNMGSVIWYSEFIWQLERKRGSLGGELSEEFGVCGSRFMTKQRDRPDPLKGHVDPKREIALRPMYIQFLSREFPRQTFRGL